MDICFNFTQGQIKTINKSVKSLFFLPKTLSKNLRKIFQEKMNSEFNQETTMFMKILKKQMIYENSQETNSEVMKILKISIPKN